MAKSMTKAEAKRAKSGMFWLITAIAGGVFFASLNSVMINQGEVNNFVWYGLVGSSIAIILLIIKKWYTTNETLAFKKR